MTSPPSPSDILAQHRRIQEALEALADQYPRCAGDPKSAFFGMTREEFDASLQAMAEEQDKQAVLMLTASAEAVLRRDFLARVRAVRNRRNSPDTEFIALFRKSSRKSSRQRSRKPTRVRLDDIISIWRTTTGASLHDLSRLIKRRHWLAHGRYWSDKSGFTADPQMVFNLITSVFLAFKNHTGDFPRTP